jgi:hypothetical protein
MTFLTLLLAPIRHKEDFAYPACYSYLTYLWALTGLAYKSEGEGMKRRGA